MKGNVKKLCNYMYFCVRESLKSASFRNLKSDKNNKIYETDLMIFESDNKDVIELMTLQALNKSTMDLFYADCMLIGKKRNDVYYTPLIYSDCTIYRDNDMIKLDIDENKQINISAISSLISKDSEELELIIEDLINLENPEVNIEKVLSGLIDLTGLEIVNKKAIILAKLPDATCGILRELKQISDIYT